MAKRKTGNSGIIYSTDPGFKLAGEKNEIIESLPANKQKLKVRLDTRQRAGKAVTLIEGFIGKNEDLEALGKLIKTFCGTGGSVKDNQIIIQGDQREKVLSWLQKNAFSLSKII